jgi:hypothetical protein
MDEVAQNAEDRRRGHEASDVRLRPLLISGLSLAALAGLSLLAMWLLFDYMADRQARLEVALSPVFEARQLPPEPRLQVSPRHDLREILTNEMEMLHTYGWVDRQAGIVRIPIERAIDLVAERGLPARRQGQGEEVQTRGAQP